MQDGGVSRWLIVVQRDHTDLYHHLEQRFRDIGFVHVVVDRRRNERRRLRLRVERDQRRADRRQPLTAKECDHWGLFGYRLVYRGRPMSPLVPSLRGR